jgi:hypothetical protein
MSRRKGAKTAGTAKKADTAKKDLKAKAAKPSTAAAFTVPRIAASAMEGDKGPNS